jgi:hypothetical protein
LRETYRVLQKGNLKTPQTVKWPAPAIHQGTDTSDLEWAATIAKEIVVHSGPGSFLLLRIDGDEMDIYVANG